MLSIEIEFRVDFRVSGLQGCLKLAGDGLLSRSGEFTSPRLLVAANCVRRLELPAIIDRRYSTGGVKPPLPLDGQSIMARHSGIENQAAFHHELSEDSRAAGAR